MPTARELEEKITARAAEDEGFRARLLANPKDVIESDYGLTIPEGYTVEVHEESATAGHLVLPPSNRLPESELATVAGGAWEVEEVSSSDSW